MITAILVVLFAWMLWVFFLAYAALRPYYQANKFETFSPLPRFAAMVTLYTALIVDVIFNITVGSIAFLELPHWRRLTLTMRCKHWKYSDTWRGKLARWICADWLNPFDPGHC